MSKDTMCKMELPDGSITISSQFEGKTYFCCSPCKKTFVKNPRKFK
ncbi:MAG: YHS domain-containing protein [Candidatus Nitrosotenuis sp.]